jgi:hypothetical protein
VPAERKQPTVAAPPAPAPAPAAGGKPALGAMRKARQALGAEPAASPEVTAPAPAAAPTPAPEAAAPAVASDLTVTLPGVQGSWDTILKGLRPRAKGMFTSGRLIGVEENRVVYGFPSATVRDMAEGQRPELEAALSAHFGGGVTVRLVVDGNGGAPSPTSSGPAPDPEPDDDPAPDLTALTDAPAAEVATPVEHLTKAFPGAEVIDEGGQ